MTGNDKLIKKSINTPSIAAFQFLYYLAPRLLNRVEIVSVRLVDIFADFATELVLVQKFAHGLLGTRPIMLRARGIVRNGEGMGIYSKDSCLKILSFGKFQ